MDIKLLLRLMLKDTRLLIQIIFFIILTSLYTLIIPLFFKIIIDYIIVLKAERLLIVFSCLIIAVVISRLMFTFIQDFFLIIFRQKMEKSLLLNYIGEMFHFKMNAMDKYQSGDIVTRLSTIMASFQYFFIEFIFYIFYAVFISLLIGLILFQLNRFFFLGTMIFLGFHLLNYFIHHYLINLQSKKYFSEKGKNASFLGQFLDGYLQIMTSWQHNHYFNLFKSKLNSQYFNFLKKEVTSKNQGVFQNLLIHANTIFIIYFGSVSVMGGSMLLGNLFLFMLLLNFLYEPVYRINNVNKSLNDALAQLKRVFEIIDHPEKETDGPVVKKEPLSAIHSIQLENVQFEFNPDKVIFENVSHHFEKNKIYLILGKSGIGKSTLFNLLIRIYAPSRGRILLNGVDYQEYHAEQIRNRTVLCLQDNLFFSDTIQNNITFFSNHVDQQQLNKALQISQSDPFVREMKDTINTVLLEGGNNLSGGQKQRLNLARSIYEAKEKDIILLDEPTSSLDKHNELMFMKSLLEIKNNKIIIIISHRHDIREYCDEVIHIENKNFKLHKKQD